MRTFDATHVFDVLVRECGEEGENLLWPLRLGYSYLHSEMPNATYLPALIRYDAVILAEVLDEVWFSVFSQFLGVVSGLVVSFENQMRRLPFFRMGCPKLYHFVKLLRNFQVSPFGALQVGLRCFAVIIITRRKSLFCVLGRQKL